MPDANIYEHRYYHMVKMKPFSVGYYGDGMHVDFSIVPYQYEAIFEKERKLIIEEYKVVHKYEYKLIKLKEGG